jgi:hypothetical protein
MPKGRTHAEITMDGRLEMADFKPDDYKCLIHAPSGQRVVCTFTRELEDDVYRALRHVARVTGLATYVRPSDRLEKIALRTVQILDPFLDQTETFFQHRTLDQLTREQGVDPAVDLRTLRDAWPDDEDVDAFLAAARNE